MVELLITALGAPHKVLTHPTCGPYMEQWELAKGHDGSAVRIHRFLRSDADAELHDHPWDNITMVLHGGYYDVTETGRTWLGVGAKLYRQATDMHRVELMPGVYPVSLFVHGPKINDWGFAPIGGPKVDWREFIGKSGTRYE